MKLPKHIINWLRKESQDPEGRESIDITGTTKFNWEKHIDGPLLYTIVYFRQIRGDLIRIFWRDEEVICYVDQSHQYPSMLGINDFEGDECHVSTLNNWAKVNT